MTKNEFKSRLLKVFLRIATGLSILLVAGLMLNPMSYFVRYIANLIITDKDIANFLIIAIPVGLYFYLFFNLDTYIDYILKEDKEKNSNDIT